MRANAGFTIVELLMSVAITAMLLTAMAGLVNNVFATRDDTEIRIDTTRDARFAMQRMVTAVSGAGRLMLPLADNPGTNWRENVREQTVPPSAPEGDSSLATAVLAVTLDPTLDLDADGFADADNDKDGLVDEDLSKDNTNDGEPGIIGIDDDGDGNVDPNSGPDPESDNDEDGLQAEDPIDGIDNDGDGTVDEDTGGDMQADSKAGLANVDDDGDGSIDEGLVPDDDEDGSINEDWLDPVVFFLSGTTLIERRPDLNPFNGTSYTEHPIAENVSQFRIERLPDSGRRSVLVDIMLTLAPPGRDAVTLNTRVRVGSGR